MGETPKTGLLHQAAFSARGFANALVSLEKSAKRRRKEIYK